MSSWKLIVGLIVVAFVAGFWLGWRGRRVETRTETKIVTQWKTQYVVKGGKTTMTPEGNLQNEGGDIVFSGSGQTDAREAKTSAPPTEKWWLSFGTGVMFPDPAWNFELGCKIGRVLFFDVGAKMMAETGSLAEFVPSRFGLGLEVAVHF